MPDCAALVIQGIPWVIFYRMTSWGWGMEFIIFTNTFQLSIKQVFQINVKTFECRTKWLDHCSNVTTMLLAWVICTKDLKVSQCLYVVLSMVTKKILAYYMLGDSAISKNIFFLVLVGNKLFISYLFPLLLFLLLWKTILW